MRKVMAYVFFFLATLLCGVMLAYVFEILRLLASP